MTTMMAMLQQSGKICDEKKTTNNFWFRTPHGKSAVASVPPTAPYDTFLRLLLETAIATDNDNNGLVDRERKERSNSPCDDESSLSTTEDDRRVRRRLSEEPLSSCSSESFSEKAFVVYNGRVLDRASYHSLASANDNNNNTGDESDIHVHLRLRLRGGMTDRQNRVGSKFGGGGQSSSSQSERERKDRLRSLALETVDLAKDPYLMRNHLGTYECKLCLTLHTNEGNYLAHTQGKKHQAGLAKRASIEAKLTTTPSGGMQQPTPLMSSTGYSSKQATARRIKIGRPGYTISKSRDLDTNQRSLVFELHYPEIDADTYQPRHRFMSAFEQKVDIPPDKRYQYLLVAAEPYETIAFKIPNERIDKSRFVSNWDKDGKRFTIMFYFMDDPSSSSSSIKGNNTITAMDDEKMESVKIV